MIKVQSPLSGRERNLIGGEIRYFSNIFYSFNKFELSDI